MPTGPSLRTKFGRGNISGSGDYILVTLVAPDTGGTANSIAVALREKER